MPGFAKLCQVVPFQREMAPPLAATAYSCPPPLYRPEFVGRGANALQLPVVPTEAVPLLVIMIRPSGVSTATLPAGAAVGIGSPGRRVMRSDGMALQWPSSPQAAQPPQTPHTPPHPSGPQSLPLHDGRQIGWTRSSFLIVLGDAGTR